jgi:Skp family chaperone for outer membrane proteins
MKKIIGVVLFIGIMVFAQQAGFAEELKIAHVSLSRVFEGYKKVVDSNKEIDAAKEEVQAMLEEIKKLNEGFDTLSAEAKEERKNQMLTKQEHIRERSLEIRKDEDRILREILKDIEKASIEIRKKKKLTYIIDDRLVIDGPKEMDLTTEVIKLLNERYKGK